MALLACVAGVEGERKGKTTAQSEWAWRVRVGDLSSQSSRGRFDPVPPFLSLALSTACHAGYGFMSIPTIA